MYTCETLNVHWSLQLIHFGLQLFGSAAFFGTLVLTVIVLFFSVFSSVLLF